MYADKNDAAGTSFPKANFRARLHMTAVGDSNPTRFIAGFQRIFTAAADIGFKEFDANSTREGDRLFNGSRRTNTWILPNLATAREFRPQVHWQLGAIFDPFKTWLPGMKRRVLKACKSAPMR